jgi:rhodanese-related sulfurtransferase
MPAKTPRKRFSRRTIVLFAILAGLLAGLVWDGSPLGNLVVRQAVALRFRTVRRVSPAELVAWMADPTRPPPLLVDARPAGQFGVSHIDGAVRLDPADPDLSALHRVSRETPIVVYSRIGAFGAAMAVALQDSGFTRVSSLDGGLFRWVNEGHPVVGDQGPARKVDPADWTLGRLLKARYRK